MSDILGVIGGSGLYEMEGLKNVRTVSVETPFGNPSDAMVVGELEGRTLAFPPPGLETFVPKVARGTWRP